MALLAQVGTFDSPTSTGNDTVTVTGFGGTPKAVILWMSSRITDGVGEGGPFSFGSAISSSNRACVGLSAVDNLAAGGSVERRHDDTKVIFTLGTGTPSTVVAAADFVSFGANQFTLNWTTVAGSSRKVGYLALGGDIEINLVSFQSPTTATSQSVAHGLTGTPTALIDFSAMNQNAPPSVDSAAEANMQIGFWGNGTDRVTGVWVGDQIGGAANRNQRGNFIDFTLPGFDQEQAEVTSVDATNVNLNWLLAVSSQRYHYLLAMRGVTAECGSFTSPSSATTKAVSVGFQAELFLCTGFMGTSSASIEDDARIMFGASDGTNEACGGMLDEDLADPTDVDHFWDSNEVIQVYDHAQTVVEAATVSSFGATDVNLNFTTAEAAANEFNFLALKDAPGSPDDTGTASCTCPITSGLSEACTKGITEM